MANPSSRLKTPRGGDNVLQPLNGDTPQTLSTQLRERGAENLTDTELLALLLRFGQSTEENALSLASQLLEEHGGLLGLRESNEKLIYQRGDTSAATGNLLAAFEVATRIAKAKLPNRELINFPDKVAQFIYFRYRNTNQEIAGALYLNARCHLIAEEEIFRGTLHRAGIEPRQILKQALLHNASRIILWHTHPSGDPAPTENDLRFTQRMVTAGELIGVGVADHLIIGHPNRWYSIRRRQDNLLEKMKETNNEWKNLKFSCGILRDFEKEVES